MGRRGCFRIIGFLVLAVIVCCVVAYFAGGPWLRGKF